MSKFEGSLQNQSARESGQAMSIACPVPQGFTWLFGDRHTFRIDASCFFIERIAATPPGNAARRRGRDQVFGFCSENWLVVAWLVDAFASRRAEL